jgi:hypothetical protein
MTVINFSKVWSYYGDMYEVGTQKGTLNQKSPSVCPAWEEVRIPSHVKMQALPLIRDEGSYRCMTETQLQGDMPRY